MCSRQSPETQQSQRTLPEAQAIVGDEPVAELQRRNQDCGGHSQHHECQQCPRNVDHVRVVLLQQVGHDEQPDRSRQQAHHTAEQQRCAHQARGARGGAFDPHYRRGRQSKGEQEAQKLGAEQQRGEFAATLRTENPSGHDTRHDVDGQDQHRRDPSLHHRRKAGSAA